MASRILRAFTPCKKQTIVVTGLSYTPQENTMFDEFATLGKNEEVGRKQYTTSVINKHSLYPFFSPHIRQISGSSICSTNTFASPTSLIVYDLPTSRNLESPPYLNSCTIFHKHSHVISRRALLSWPWTQFKTTRARAK